MELIRTRAFRYRVPMQPTRIGSQEHVWREGLLLCDADTESFWGEASPLPGFSRESLEEVIADWRGGPPYHAASLRFAQYSIAERLCPATALVTADPLRIPVNGFLQGTSDNVLRDARRIAAEDFRAVKLKVGGSLGSPMQSAEVVLRVRESLRADQSLRLDANRCWSLAEATDFVRRIGSCPIEYIEEPLNDPNALETLWQTTGVPYALDETLRDLGTISQFPHAVALVVKPTILGVGDTVELLRTRSRPLVFSAAFESGVGTVAVAKLAALYAPGIPAGLDVYRRLKSDTLAHRLQYVSGELMIPAALEIDRSTLIEVPR